jgi:hypothetical protein
MKKLTLLIAMLMATSAWAENIEGSMSCTFKSLQITKIFDGKTDVYSGIEGGIRVG